MSADEIYQRLQGLKLFGMAALCDELLGHRERPLPPPEQWLKRMIEAEESERQCRSIRYQMGIAKFPLARDLDSFDSSDSPVDPEQLRALDRDDFLAHIPDHFSMLIDKSVNTLLCRLDVAFSTTLSYMTTLPTMQMSPVELEYKVLLQ